MKYLYEKTVLLILKVIRDMDRNVGLLKISFNAVVTVNIYIVFIMC